MFGPTITITVNGTDVTLNKINQDNYSAEFLHRNSASEHKMLISHNTVKNRSLSKGSPYETHYAKLTKTTFATDTAPELIVESSFSVKAYSSDSKANLPAKSLADFCSTNVDELLLWAI